MEIETLMLKNPWWKGKDYFKEDEDYRKWLSKKVRWYPSLAKSIELKPFSLHFILGPRQVGKTTLIKLLIKNLLERKVDPRSIFYFRCDDIKDFKELRELLSKYVELRERWNVKSSFIFLDEISFPEEWYRAIKSMIDDGIFKRDVLVLSSSASIKVKKEVELFPGRRGHGKDFILYPLSFREFLKVTSKEVYNNLPERLKTFDKEEVVEKVLKVLPFLRELNKSLEVFFRVGGFPLAINSFFSNGYVTNEVKETYLTWIKNDLARVGRSPEMAREILKVVLTKIPNPMSWEGVSKETSIKSPKTINAYLHVLQDMFTLLISYFIDPHTMVLRFGKNKKIHFVDPLIFSVLEEWCMVRLKERESLIAESVLASHLARRFKEVYYWRDGKEINCVVRSKHKLIGFECKWRRRVKVGKMREVYFLSKREFEPERGVVPLSIFLSLL